MPALLASISPCARNTDADDVLLLSTGDEAPRPTSLSGKRTAFTPTLLVALLLFANHLNILLLLHGAGVLHLASHLLIRHGSLALGHHLEPAVPFSDGANVGANNGTLSFSSRIWVVIGLLRNILHRTRAARTLR